MVSVTLMRLWKRQVRKDLVEGSKDDGNQWLLCVDSKSE